MVASTVTVKVFNNCVPVPETRRCVLQWSSFASLCSDVRTSFGQKFEGLEITDGLCSVQYRDTDGDWITMSSQGEFEQVSQFAAEPIWLRLVTRAPSRGVAAVSAAPREDRVGSGEERLEEREMKKAVGRRLVAATEPAELNKQVAAVLPSGTCVKLGSNPGVFRVSYIDGRMALFDVDSGRSVRVTHSKKLDRTQVDVLGGKGPWVRFDPEMLSDTSLSLFSPATKQYLDVRADGWFTVSDTQQELTFCIVPREVEDSSGLSSGDGLSKKDQKKKLKELKGEAKAAAKQAKQQLKAALRQAKMESKQAKLDSKLEAKAAKKAREGSVRAQHQDLPQSVVLAGQAFYVEPVAGNYCFFDPALNRTVRINDSGLVSITGATGPWAQFQASAGTVPGTVVLFNQKTKRFLSVNGKNLESSTDPCELPFMDYHHTPSVLPSVMLLASVPFKVLRVLDSYALLHPQHGKCLRMNDDGKVTFNGGRGPWVQFVVSVEGGAVVMYNKQTKRYLVVDETFNTSLQPSPVCPAEAPVPTDDEPCAPPAPEDVEVLPPVSWATVGERVQLVSVDGCSQTLFVAHIQSTPSVVLLGISASDLLRMEYDGRVTIGDGADSRRCEFLVTDHGNGLVSFKSCSTGAYLCYVGGMFVGSMVERRLTFSVNAQ